MFTKMSVVIDKALMAMSLDEDDEPFMMPNLPEFCASEKNELSLIGRILNPNSQKVSNVVLTMPRKWQKIGRVRGLALSKERFQFIFSKEYDLLEIMEKGFQTFNEWGLVLDRWMEKPPSDFLQFVKIWVQIRNIPVNHYTDKAITALGELIGQVLEVVCDPDKPQNQDFVRVLIKFDVSRPLRKSKVIGLPHGQSTTIYFHYERVQKRCYNCQRLTHEADLCPILLLRKHELEDRKLLGLAVEKPKPALVLKDSDPLFGILEESQVGINPLTGRPRIAPEILEGMRQYLVISNGEDRAIREARVKNSVAKAEKDPFTKKAVLQLEPIPIVSHDLNKSKGLVFGYESEDSSTNSERLLPKGEKLMAGAFQAEETRRNRDIQSTLQTNLALSSHLASISPPGNSTVYRIGLSEAGPSGVPRKTSKPRRRPSKGHKKSLRKDLLPSQGEVSLTAGTEEGFLEKRKAEFELDGVSKAAKPQPPEMVPKGGPSNA
ncbi:PREDICTED: uncharacterized protein LOC104791160 [Camelina sativa]|uniref:Uncharacterized protein LOC104791160 n=1 Tax=Camelina sativa TaxID=90675 RepID=A0ABM0ZG67_CAMSA|nr:PREDICTED: uncharacterized protein LOC104791160 [Camelina sativa]XP_010515283.1 PREDICTED: uncharacterized protein LOC104791160 [Camelina sativa]XP_010515284.1 PREDICTED: uncharacterized protein LOC104791160 [Camelina sativa]XP_010515285.1 PREDICTED: uncharacterized protein LOC104791160 [Camelina sativa]